VTSVLDVLFLRRPAIDYVSPAICEVNFSNSGGPIIILNPLPRLVGPTGLVLGGDGHDHRLSWNRYPGALCYSVYKLVDELDPFGPYQLIAECISDNFIDLDGPGHYRITVITPDGETPFSDPYNVVFPNPPVPPVETTIEAVNGIYVAQDFSDDGIIAGYTITGLGAFWKAGVTTTPDFGGASGALQCAKNGRVGGASLDALSNGLGLWQEISGLPVDAGTDILIESLNTAGVAAATGAGGIVYRYTNGVGLLDLGNLGESSVIGHDSVVGSSPFRSRTINDSGYIAVTSKDLIPQFHACLWNGVALLDITPPAADVSSSFSVNNAGHVLGAYKTLASTTRGFLFDGVSYFDIVVSAIVDTTPYNFNSTDQACGAYNTGVDLFPFWWESGAAQPITLLPGMTSGEAYSINDAGWVVGYMTNGITQTAFIYKIDENEVLSLFDLLPAATDWNSLESALFVNNNKQIVGFGTYLGTPGTIFLLTLP
jgi:uncharacterized membrane protein